MHFESCDLSKNWGRYSLGNTTIANKLYLLLSFYGVVVIALVLVCWSLVQSLVKPTLSVCYYCANLKFQVAFMSIRQIIDMNTTQNFKQARLDQITKHYLLGLNTTKKQLYLCEFLSKSHDPYVVRTTLMRATRAHSQQVT